MGAVPEELAEKLALRLGIRRAVETGTYYGAGADRLGTLFSSVETIELSRRLAWRARFRLFRRRNVTVRRGSSVELLRPAREPTLYWLDAHWSGGETVGKDYECPVLEEVRKTSPGTERDCYLIDDARLFLAPPPPPHRAEAWPTFAEIRQTFSEVRPQHILGVVGDVIAAVPAAAADAIRSDGTSSSSPG